MRKHENIARVVSTALRQDELSGIVDVLKTIAQSVEAYGCILWESDEARSEQLFVLASWFGDASGKAFELPLHELPVEGSANGLAIRNREVQNVTSIKDDPRTYKHPLIVDSMNLVSLCAVPVDLETDQGQFTKASLCVYRNEADRPFGESEVRFIERISDLIPGLYRAMGDRVGRALLERINGILDGLERAKDQPDSIRTAQIGLKEVCNAVAETFQCVETTVFLENRLQAEKVFTLYATTCPNWNRENSYCLADKQEGLTGWVLENKHPLRIFNLASFENDKPKLRQEYLALDWRHSLKLKASARTILSLPENSELPPLSFIAAPIVKGDTLLGVIRCCTARRAPWVFGQRQLSLLQIVATLIGRFWSDWLQHLEVEEENLSWQALVNDISNLNQLVQSEMARPGLEDKLYNRILNTASRVIGGDILDIRLHDEVNNELYFAKWKGSSWERKGSRQEVQDRINKRFSLKRPVENNGSIGIKAFHEGKVHCVMNAEADQYQSTTFPETKRIVVAPIGIKQKTIGLLDVRGTSNKPFSAHAPRLAEILGRQLGLYLSLRQNEQQQRQVFEDLFHQLKGPVKQTFARAESLVQRIISEQWHMLDAERADEIEYEVKILRAVARKAKRVTHSAGLFRDLAVERKLQLSPYRLRRIRYDELLKMLKEANMDTQHALENEREIKFRVREETFKDLNNDNLKADPDLLEQAANCLLDNAGKYSFSSTLVWVSYGEQDIDGKKHLYIAVSNRGLPITPEESSQVKERNYRGDSARYTTGEGSGIGLWIVDHIMQAHKGQLEIIPTNVEGWTEVRLNFPASS